MTDESPIQPHRGVYNARRAAALAGIPLRTLHHWAQTGFYRPSISPDPHEYLWSWSDLLALRAIDWLRRTKDNPSAPRVPATRIRQALVELEASGLPRHQLRELVVSNDGRLYFQDSDGQTIKADRGRQAALPGVLNLVSAYQDRGPDLLEPRRLLRIVPGKLGGEPHVIHTRISTALLYACHRDGYTNRQIREMYPDISDEALDQAIEFEQSLATAA